MNPEDYNAEMERAMGRTRFILWAMEDGHYVADLAAGSFEDCYKAMGETLKSGNLDGIDTLTIEPDSAFPFHLINVNVNQYKEVVRNEQ